MKKPITEEIEIPQGVSCHYDGSILSCKKDSIETKRKIELPNVIISVKDSKIVFSSTRSNKKDRNAIISFIQHIKNMFLGLEKKFTYKLEACNVHFPMTLKVEGNKLAINNFLGEKTPRFAEIIPEVEVQIKGNIITLSSHDKEAAGQTAGNFEKATKVRNRDRRIFQDGIYIVEKAEEKR